jgi:hypothetical protein
MPPPQPFPFMRLPVELRIMVYERLTITATSYKFSRPSCLKIRLNQSPSAILVRYHPTQPAYTPHSPYPQATCTLVRQEATRYIERMIESIPARMPTATIDVDRLRQSGDFEILSHTLAIMSQRLVGLKTPPATPTHLHRYSHVPPGWSTNDLRVYQHWVLTEMAICKLRIASQRGLTHPLPDFKIALRCESEETVPLTFSMHNVCPVSLPHARILLTLLLVPGPANVARQIDDRVPQPLA